MSDKYSERFDDQDGDAEDGHGYRDPIEENDGEWCDDQYGRITDPRHLAEAHVLNVYDEGLTALEAMMGEISPLTMKHLSYAKAAGNSEKASRHIQNAAVLAGCYSKLMGRYDASLKTIGKSR